VISHEDASDLLGAYALDAVDADERTAVDLHLRACPRCQTELDSLREVAAALGNSAEPPPEGLWSSIAAQLGDDHDRPERDEPPPMPRLGRSVPAPFKARSSGRTRRARSAALLVSAIAVYASAVAVVLGIDLMHSQNTVTNLQTSTADQQTVARRTPAQVALHTAGHRVVTLENAAGDALASFVVVPPGRGYLMSSDLPALGRGKTYQLWGIVGGTPISLGLLGSSPRNSTFTVEGAQFTSKLAVTAEPDGGTVAPTGPIVASGTL
jgi:anti-sigma-K factor RskA